MKRNIWQHGIKVLYKELVIAGNIEILVIPSAKEDSRCYWRLIVVGS